MNMRRLNEDAYLPHNSQCLMSILASSFNRIVQAAEARVEDISPSILELGHSEIHDLQSIHYSKILRK